MSSQDFHAEANYDPKFKRYDMMHDAVSSHVLLRLQKRELDAEDVSPDTNESPFSACVGDIALNISKQKQKTVPVAQNTKQAFVTIKQIVDFGKHGLPHIGLTFNVYVRPEVDPRNDQAADSTPDLPEATERYRFSVWFRSSDDVKDTSETTIMTPSGPRKATKEVFRPAMSSFRSWEVDGLNQCESWSHPNAIPHRPKSVVKVLEEGIGDELVFLQYQVLGGQIHRDEEFQKFMQARPLDEATMATIEAVFCAKSCNVETFTILPGRYDPFDVLTALVEFEDTVKARVPPFEMCMDEDGNCNISASTKQIHEFANHQSCLYNTDQQKFIKQQREQLGEVREYPVPRNYYELPLISRFPDLKMFECWSKLALLREMQAQQRVLDQLVAKPVRVVVQRAGRQAADSGADAPNEKLDAEKALLHKHGFVYVKLPKDENGKNPDVPPVGSWFTIDTILPVNLKAPPHESIQQWTGQVIHPVSENVLKATGSDFIMYCYLKWPDRLPLRILDNIDDVSERDWRPVYIRPRQDMTPFDITMTAIDRFCTESSPLLLNMQSAICYGPGYFSHFRYDVTKGDCEEGSSKAAAAQHRWKIVLEVIKQTYSLTEQQLTVLQEYNEMKMPLLIVVGPGGTAKTQLKCLALILHLASGHRCLVCASNNGAVDNIATRFWREFKKIVDLLPQDIKGFFEDMDFLRYEMHGVAISAQKDIMDYNDQNASELFDSRKPFDADAAVENDPLFLDMCRNLTARVSLDFQELSEDLEHLTERLTKDQLATVGKLTRVRQDLMWDYEQLQKRRKKHVRFPAVMSMVAHLVKAVRQNESSSTKDSDISQFSELQKKFATNELENFREYVDVTNRMIAKIAARCQVVFCMPVACADKIMGMAEEEFGARFTNSTIEDASSETIIGGIIPLGRAERWTEVYGDLEQLSAVLSSDGTNETMKTLNYSILSYLVHVKQYPRFRQHIQYRMSPPISRIAKGLYYPTLKDHEGINSNHIVAQISRQVSFEQYRINPINPHDPAGGFGPKAQRLPGYELNILNVYRGQMIKEANGDSWENWAEATQVAILVEQLIKAGMDPAMIVILAYYSGQLAALQVKLAERGLDGIVECSTVDAYQGKDKECVILCMVVTQKLRVKKSFTPEDVESDQSEGVGSGTKGKIGYSMKLSTHMKDPRRLCVALTRARYALWIVMNAHVFQWGEVNEHIAQPQDRFRWLIADAKRYGYIADVEIQDAQRIEGLFGGDIAPNEFYEAMDRAHRAANYDITHKGKHNKAVVNDRLHHFNIDVGEGRITNRGPNHERGDAVFPPRATQTGTVDLEGGTSGPVLRVPIERTGGKNRNRGKKGKQAAKESKAGPSNAS